MFVQFDLKMARGTRSHRRFASREYRSTPYPYPLSCCGKKCVDNRGDEKKSSKQLDKIDWEDAVCSVCMDFPHNAVLLLCSSYEKGCRPYMCGTSYRHSNCLDQFKKAYTKVMSPQRGHDHGSVENPSFGSGTGWPSKRCELACPLCRGPVKGWTVVEAAREYLNAKRRSCMQDDCSFVGTYKELRKHVKAVHPSAAPHKVDPILEQNWTRLQHEREREDVISTIRSSMPGAMVLGDYVIETGAPNGFDSDDEDVEDDEDGEYEVGDGDSSWLNVLFLLQAFGPAGNASFSSRLRRLERGYRALGESRSHSRSRRGLPAIASGGPSASVISELEGQSASQGGVGLGRSEHRRRRRSRRSVIDVS